VSRTFAFVQVDVFTDRVFGGNQLAVFFNLEPGALSDAEMQAIALEMNLAETTFVYPPRRAECVAAVRIFTPGRELPFAGHPTVGTTWVLANRGRLPAGERNVILGTVWRDHDGGEASQRVRVLPGVGSPIASNVD